MPKFPELSVEKIWPFIKDDSELSKYFPKYKAKQMLNRDYLWTVLSTIRPDQVSNLRKEALEKRSVQNDKEIGETIKISNKWMESLNNTIDIPSKIMNLKSLATKGKAFHFLKLKHKDYKERKQAKKYLANTKQLVEKFKSNKRTEEEVKDENYMKE